MDILEELSALRRADCESATRVRDFSAAFRGPGLHIIAEVKKASPSEGVIRADFDPLSIARAYATSGAAAISVLCEPHRFLGSDHYLEEIRRTVDVPLLYKDFITTPFQIQRARACGADACLLIAAVLDDAKLKELLGVVHSLGMQALVETHTEDEIKRAVQVGAKIIGVNCRNLRTFKTDPSLTAELVAKIPAGIVKIGESGIKTHEDILEIKAAGADGFLIGTTLMRAQDPGMKLKELATSETFVPLSTRIPSCFSRAKSEGRGAFVAYLTMGYPTLSRSEEAVDALIAGGADVIELGIPFRDPHADGEVIRNSAFAALEQGVTPDDVFSAARRLRAKHPDTAFVVFSYYGVIASKGFSNFAKATRQAGIDAVLCVDLPDARRDEFLRVIRAFGLAHVPLILRGMPVSHVVERVAGLSNTFVYVVTAEGKTGIRAELPPDLPDRLEAIRQAVKLPIAAGFGIATKAQADVVSAHADGFIVGSALVKRLGSGSPLTQPLLP